VFCRISYCEIVEKVFLQDEVSSVWSILACCRIGGIQLDVVCSYTCLCINILVGRESCGPGIAVSIAIDYGLDGSGSNPDGYEIFRPSIGPIQPPAKWVPGLTRG